MKFTLKNRFTRFLLLILLSGMIFSACKDLEDHEKYTKPEWLAGKLYTQISSFEDLSVFTSLLENTGYDTILDLTGSFAVFAPTDEAFQQWFEEHPELDGDVSNLPVGQQLSMVQYHILQNRWSKKQIQSLDIYGWIDRDDPNNDKPRAYKRQSIYQQPDRKYWIRRDDDAEYIIDSTESSEYKIVYSNSRKYLPLFYDEYFDIHDLNGEDYEFYYERSYEHGKVYIANARTLNDEIPAENGFIYKIDQVIRLPLNAEELLSMEHGGNTTSAFLDMIYEFPEFSANDQATFQQSEAKAGGKFDTLYNLDYPRLCFNIQEELTGSSTSSSRYTLRYQNGMAVPSDDAFQDYINSVLTVNSGYPHWPDFESVPVNVRRLILDAHMSNEPIYRSDFASGFRNNAGDRVFLNEGNIVYKYYGSNATFMILDEAIQPRALTSVTGPVYLRPGFSIMMYAMESSNTLSALKKINTDYVLFAPPDKRCLADSSLLLNWIPNQKNRYYFMALNRGTGMMERVDNYTLKKRILNQVAISRPTGAARKEFIENLAGNFIVFDNVNNTASGGMENAFGYRGDSAVYSEPLRMEEETDNGITYQFNSWFRTPITGMFSRLSAYPVFMELLLKAKLASDVYYNLPFLVDGAHYTVFVPSEEVLLNSGADTLSISDLQQFLKYHFVRGERIWTDGSKPSGRYETLRIDESSSPSKTLYSSLNIETGYDYINILRDDNSLYCNIPEHEEKTNIMAAFRIVEKEPGPHDYIITGVVHEIDSVLTKYQLAR